MKEEVSKFHALQLFTDTFIAEVVHLDNHSVGIYIRLLCFSWTKNAAGLTKDQAYKICQCKTDDCNNKVDSILTEFFKITSKNNKEQVVYQNKRLVKEHDYLIKKYKKKSASGSKGAEVRWDKNSSANGKDIAPIPNPIPIPKINIKDKFDSFWKLIKSKKGSRFLALQRFEKYCGELDEKELSLKYNKYSDSIKDKQFQKHVSTWINQRCFEDEEERKECFVIEKPIIFEHEGKKLRKVGETGFYYDLADDDGKRYKKHKWKDEPILND